MSQTEFDKFASIKRRFVTVAVFNAFIDPGTCHEDVPGTIFTEYATYHFLRWTGKYCGNSPIEILPRIEEQYRHRELIDSVGNYLSAPGHFGPEQLPRLLRLLATVPPTAKVLVAQGGIADQFVDILVERDIVTRDRIIPYEKNNHLNYFANIVYRSESYPFLQGNEKTYFIYDRTDVQLTHRAIVGDDLPIDKRDCIILIKREVNKPRSLINHLDLVTFIQTRLNKSKLHLEIFEAHGHLREHIALFRRARLIIGAHGAGMMNVLWAAPKTHVIEIGYSTGMTLPDMYAIMSLHLNHRYWICIGHGDYGKPFHVDMDDFNYIFNQVIEEMKTDDKLF